MATEVEIISTLDNTDTIKSLKETEKEVRKTTKTLGALEDQAEDLNERFKKATFGTDEFKQLQKDLVQVNREIKNVELSIESLDTDQVASEVGGLVGGFADVATGAVFAFGISQESAEAFLGTLAQVEGVGRIVKGSIEGVSAGVKLYNNQIKTGALLTKLHTFATSTLGVAQKALAIGTKIVTGTFKSLRGALISTGIGAIIVGIGLLIANFDKLGSAVKAVGEFFSFIGNLMRDTLFGILEFFGLVDKGTLDQIKAQEALTDATLAANIAAEKLHKETLKRIAEQRDAQQEIIEQIQRRADIDKKETTLALKQAEARGASAEELFQIQKKANEETLRLAKEEFAAKQQIIELNRIQAQAELDRLETFLNTQAIISGFTQMQIDDLRIRIEEEKKLFLENEEDKIGENRRTLETIEADNQIFLNRKNDQSNKAAQKLADDLLARRIAAQAKLDEFEIKAIEDDQARQEAQAQFAFDNKIAKLNEQIPEEAALLRQFEIELHQSLLDIQKEFDQKELEQQFEQNQRLEDLRIQLIEGRRVSAADQFAVDTEISNSRFDLELELLRFQLDQKQITEEEFRLSEQILVQAHQNAITDIEAEAAEKRKKKAKEEADKKIATAQFLLDTSVEFATALDEIVDNLGKKNEASELKRQKRRFIRDKAFAAVQAAIKTSQAVVNALASAPPPLSFALAATAGTLGGAQVSAILSKQFNPNGGGGGSAPSVGGGGSAASGFTSSVGGAGAGAQAVTPTTSTGAGGDISFDEEPGTNQPGGGGTPQPIEAFVLTNKIGNALDASVAIELQSEL